MQLPRAPDLPPAAVSGPDHRKLLILFLPAVASIPTAARPASTLLALRQSAEISSQFNEAFNSLCCALDNHRLSCPRTPHCHYRLQAGNRKVGTAERSSGTADRDRSFPDRHRRCLLRNKCRKTVRLARPVRPTPCPIIAAAVLRGLRAGNRHRAQNRPIRAASEELLRARKPIERLSRGRTGLGHL